LKFIKFNKELFKRYKRVNQSIYKKKCLKRKYTKKAAGKIK